MLNTTNPFLMLELGEYRPDPDFVDPKVIGTADADPAVQKTIQDALRTCEGKWTKGQKHPRNGPIYKARLDKKNEILTALSTLEQRKSAYQAAKAELSGQLRRRLKYTESRGYAFEEEIQKIAADFETSERNVRNFISVEIRAEADKGTELQKPAGSERFKELQELAARLGGADAYEVLAAGTPLDRTTAQPAEVWRGTAQNMLKGMANHHDQETADRTKLCGLCETLFADEASKAKYDAFLVWFRLDLRLKAVVDATSVDKTLTAEMQRDCVDELYSICGDKKKAEGYLRFVCKEKGIAQPSVPLESTKEPCPYCSAMNEASAAKCLRCGAELAVTCPKCGKKQRLYLGKNFCEADGCGYDFRAITRAAALCETARAQIGKLNLAAAKGLLDDAELLYAGSPEIAVLRAEWAREQKRFGAIAERLRAYTDAKELVRAKAELDTLRGQFPTFSDRDVETRIEAGLAAAKAEIEQAARAALPAERVRHAIAAYRACADYPGVRDSFGAPPKAPASAEVRADGLDRSNYVSWRASGDTNITYRVLRKRDSRPLDANDGELLAEVSGGSYIDRTVPAGEAFTYAVCACLGPVRSEIAVCGPVVNCFEVRKLSFVANNGTVQAGWQGLPAGAEVEIWRSTAGTPARPGDGVAVRNANATGLLDDRLENDTTYYYRVFAKYRAGGQWRYSAGVTFQATPATPPQPVSFIQAVKRSGRVFDLSWDQPGQEEVAFFFVAQGAAYREGDTVSLDALSASAKAANVEGRGGTGRLTLPGDEVYYLMAVTVKSGMGVVGVTVPVSCKELIRIRSILPSGESLFLNFDWPENVGSVLLLYRRDRYPASVGEADCTRMRVKKAVFDLNNAVALKGLTKGTYYFSLFAELEVNGQRAYSAPSNATYRYGTEERIECRFTPVRAVFGGVRGVRVNVDMGPGRHRLPALVVNANAGSLPFFRSQGFVFGRIPEQQINGAETFLLESGKLGANLFLRVFTADEAEEANYIIALAPGAGAKIS